MAQAGAVGFEPTIYGFKVRCLTTWPRPSERWAHQDLNLGPTGYEPAALTAELWARLQQWIDKRTDRAGDGDRTRNNSLEGCGNTILQRPQSGRPDLNRRPRGPKPRALA